MNKNNTFYISIDNFQTLCFNTIEKISISDLGWWLECKTNDQYTIVEYNFLRETFALLETINTTNKEFKEKWFESLDTIRIRGLKQ